MLKNRFVLSEDDNIELEEPIILDTPIEDVEAPKSNEEKIGVTQMLSDLIKDEWEAIDGYKSTIATLTSLGGHEELIKVLEDISTEEMVHVGELEKCLTLVSPEAVQIEDGKQEAEETMNTIEEPIIQESTNKKIRHGHKLKEDFKYSGKGYEDYIAYWMDEADSEIDYLIMDGDDEDEEIQKLRMLNDEGIEKLCYDCAERIANSDYLWEQINESITDCIFENINDAIENPEYLKFKPTEFELPEKSEEDKPDEN